MEQIILPNFHNATFSVVDAHTPMKTVTGFSITSEGVNMEKTGEFKELNYLVKDLSVSTHTGKLTDLKIMYTSGSASGVFWLEHVGGNWLICNSLSNFRIPVDHEILNRKNGKRNDLSLVMFSAALSAFGGKVECYSDDKAVRKFFNNLNNIYV